MRVLSKMEQELLAPQYLFHSIKHLTERGDQIHLGGKVFPSGYLCLECRNSPQYFFTTNASEDYQYKREEEGIGKKIL